MTEKGSIGEIVITWYRSSLHQNSGAARTARARLKRCISPAEALAVAETHELNTLLKRYGERPSVDQLALLAIIFARLRSVNGEKLAAKFGTRTMKDGPRKLRELRFQALIRVRTRRDLIAPLRRALAVLGPDPSCNGRALAEDLYFWNDRVRSAWCFQYFGAEFAATNQGESVQ
ncbi:MAG: type I-E CRISPR-associated protein Cse2/CasB [Acidobacteria bacterium]|nr:type I-E CRISPR-associated protein Cse2/CasB [Acidobacteriota bacterium]